MFVCILKRSLCFSLRKALLWMPSYEVSEHYELLTQRWAGGRCSLSHIEGTRHLGPISLQTFGVGIPSGSALGSGWQGSRAAPRLSCGDHSAACAEKPSSSTAQRLAGQWGPRHEPAMPSTARQGPRADTEASLRQEARSRCRILHPSRAGQTTPGQKPSHWHNRDPKDSPEGDPSCAQLCLLWAGLSCGAGPAHGVSSRWWDGPVREPWGRWHLCLAGLLGTAGERQVSGSCSPSGTKPGWRCDVLTRWGLCAAVLNAVLNAGCPRRAPCWWGGHVNGGPASGQKGGIWYWQVLHSHPSRRGQFQTATMGW